MSIYKTAGYREVRRGRRVLGGEGDLPPCARHAVWGACSNEDPAHHSDNTRHLAIDA